MEKFILVVHVLAAASVIGLVLLQHGKGADMGAAFGSGASGSLFGVSGSSNLLSRLTALFVAIFFATSLTLAYMASHRANSGSVVKLPASESNVSGSSDASAQSKEVPELPVKSNDIPE